MPAPFRVPRVVGLVAAGTIGVSTALVGVPAVAQASPGLSFSTAAGDTSVTVPSGICAIDWTVIGSRGGADATNQPGYSPIGSKVRSVVTQGDSFTLVAGGRGADAVDGGAGGTNPQGGGVWNGGNATDSASGGGGAASVVLRNGSLYLAGLGGIGGGAGGGSHGHADGNGSAVLVPAGPTDERSASLPPGESQGYVSGTGVACGTFTNTDVPRPVISSVAPGPGQLTAWFTAGLPGQPLPAGVSWQYSLDGTTWLPTDTRSIMGANSFHLDGLTNGQEYTLRMRATSPSGNSEVATAPRAVTPFVLPGRPTSVTVQAQPGRLVLGWAPPTEVGTFPLTGYRVTVIEADATEDDPGAEYRCDTDAAARGCTVEVPPGDYVAYVSAVDGHGVAGPYEVVSTPRKPMPEIPATVPDKDGDLTGATGPITTVTAGKTVVLKGSGYAPGSTVRALVYSTPRELTTVVADANGEFEVTVTIPADLPAGQHSLVVTGFDANGDVRNLRVDVTVSGPGAAPVVDRVALAGTGGDGTSGSALAYTGAPVVVPAVGGVAALAVGAGLLVVSRRRREGAPE